LIDETYLALSTIWWSGDIQGFYNDEPINNLAQYATHQWFSNIHENQMLDILQWELLLDPAEQSIEVQSLIFMTWIKWAYKQCNSAQYA
jgi:hypothetical protein